MTKRKASVPDEDMATASILEYFASVPDPRVERSQLHPLASVLVLSLCAVICAANSFLAIESFGHAREAWLRTFLDLPNGIGCSSRQIHGSDSAVITITWSTCRA